MATGSLTACATLIYSMNSTRTSTSGRSRPLLLLIEDDRNALVAGAHLLAACGFEVVIARGGEDGIAKATRLQPDVIVTDLLMPNTSGVDVCARLHVATNTRSIPLIVYTGLTDAAVLGRLRGFGVRVFAIKPCVPMVIGREAHALLNERGEHDRVRVVTGYGETLTEFGGDIEAYASQPDMCDAR